MGVVTMVMVVSTAGGGFFGGPRGRAVTMATTSSSRVPHPRRGTKVKTFSSSSSNKGFGLLEWAGDLVPQPLVVKTTKFAWKEAWKTMTRELAPQDGLGAYTRPNDAFVLGEDEFRDSTKVPTSGLFLYTGNACPWCHRVSFAVKLLGLDSRVRCVQLEDDAERATRGGWIIAGRDKKRDPCFLASDLREVYESSSPGYVGRCTAPVLVDGNAKRILSNNSTNILRCLNHLAASASREDWGAVNLWPAQLEDEIVEMNGYLYSNLNNAVYQAGFSTTQDAHDAAASKVFDCLDRLEAVLGEREFLMGDKITASDLLLLPTLCRFDAAYAVLFKCSRRRVTDYPQLTSWMQRMFELEGSHETFDLEAAKQSYYKQLFPLNPSGIVPYGPTLSDLGVDNGLDRKVVRRGSPEFLSRVHLAP